MTYSFWNGKKGNVFPSLLPGSAYSPPVKEEAGLDSARVSYRARPWTGYVPTYYVLMNLTLSVDEKVVRRARRVAESMGMSLNQAVRQFLTELAGGDSVERDIAELEDLSARSKGKSGGRRFDRDQAHERA